MHKAAVQASDLRPVPPLGIATTTPVAFLVEGALWLERMNILALDGAGILSDQVIPIGTVMPVVFRLSVAQRQVRCRAEVLGHGPLTPAGLRAQRRGEAPTIVGLDDAGSATAIFRLSDLKPSTGTRTPAATLPVSKGFGVRFVDLDAEAREALAHHLRTSLFLAERLGLDEGEGQDRKMGDAFLDGDLSDRAHGW